jgi:phosphatidylglycerol:prolipoprotein diacylglycerol transferase
MPGFPFAVTFPSNPYSLAPAGTPLFPSQLTESAALFILAPIFLYILRRKTFDGQVLLLYIMAYGFLRSVLEIYRGDSIRGFVISPWLSTSQFISGCLILLAAVTYVYLKRRGKTQ